MKKTLLFFLFFCANINVFAQTDISYKSVFLSRFLQNIHFPAGIIKNNEIVIGVAGDENTLKNVNVGLGGQTIKGYRIVVKPVNEAKDIRTINLLYINNTTKIYLSSIFQELQNRTVIAVTEKDGFLQKGSDLNFLKPEDRWTYEINENQLSAKGFTYEKEIVTRAYNRGGANMLAKNDKVNRIEIKVPKVNTEEERKLRDDYIKAQKELEAYKALSQRIRTETVQVEVDMTPEEKKKFKKELDELNSNLSQEQQKAKLIALQTEKYKTEKEQENLRLKQEREKSQIQQQQTTIISAIIVIFLALLALFFFIFNRRRKKIIEQLEITKNELAHNLQLINTKNQEIEKHSRETEQSIYSAKTIQTSMLPTASTMQQYLGDYFLIYEPKDIVSGDFYWITQKQNKIFVIVADCTGHGVPGAFMSLVGMNLLDEIINQKNIFSPDQILEEMHIGVYHRLQQDTGINKDGMDMCLCIMEKNDTGQTQVQFAGAKRPFYFIQNGQLQRIQGSRKYIGGISKESKNFEKHEFLLEKNTMLYLTSDGYADAPNEKREKFSSQRLEDLFIEIHQKDLNTQRKILVQTLETHKGVAKNRDDNTVLGIRI